MAQWAELRAKSPKHFPENFQKIPENSRKFQKIPEKLHKITYNYIKLLKAKKTKNVSTFVNIAQNQ
jgi:hypothetical protein